MTPVLFDLDGTLIDASGDLHAACNALRADHRLPPVDLATVHRYIGPGRPFMVRGVLAEAGDIDLDAEMARFGEHIRQTEPSGTRVLPGARQALVALQGRPLAVVTNKPQENTDAVLDGLGLRDLVPVAVGPAPGRPLKPDPQMLHLALEQLGCDPDGGWYIGDAVTDVLAGRAAGLRTVAVTWGMATAERLAEAEPDALVDDFDSLVALLVG